MQATQEREGSPGHRRRGHVEVEGELAVATQMEAARCVEERRDLGERVTATRRCDGRELIADVLR
jgi:hypothetical protein